MFGAFGASSGALGGFNHFSNLLAQTVEDSTTVFSDAFNPFAQTPEELLPKRPSQRQSTVEVPTNRVPYEWAKLTPGDKRMIRLVTIEKDTRSLQNSAVVPCSLLDSTASTERVTCRITMEDLDSLPKDGYEAVSYSWLDMSAEVPLVINENEILDVNPSLIACLQHLLRKQEKVTLWWDNICVKQTDKDEIASQVQLMKDIFGNAKRTYIWLGDSDSDSQLALQTLSRICRLDEHGHTPAADCYSRAQELVRDLRDPNSEASVRRVAIARLLNRTYWQRAWIYQEAAASKEIAVLIGDQELDFDRLCDAVEAFCRAEGDSIRRTNISLGNPLQVVAYGYNALLAIRQGRMELQSERAVSANYLQTLLCRVAGSVRATSEHDLVYAFLGFQDPVHSVPLTVDYDIPIGIAYNVAAQTLTEQSKTWIFWEYAVVLAASNCSLRGRQTGVIGFLKASQYIRRLATRGRIIDKVAATSGIQFNYSDRNNLGINSFIRLQDHVNFCRRQPNAGGQGEDLEHRVLRVLLAEGAFEHADRDFDGNPTFDRQKFHLQALLDAHNNDSAIRRARGGVLGLVSSSQQKAYKTLRRQSLICVHKMMFVSQAGRIGLVAQDVRVGDVVAILNGSRVPLVLREMSKSLYRVVGQAYLEGAMYGNMVDWKNDSGADEIVLV